MKYLLAFGVTLAILAGCNTTPTKDSGGAKAESRTTIFPKTVTKPKIMIVGDSISAGPGCYKKYLVKDLNDNGISNFEFVGSYTDDCGGGVRHSAVSCSTTTNFLAPDFTIPGCFKDKTFAGMNALMATHSPDMVMLQLGVNDVWGGSTPVDNVLGNYEKLITQARAHNPNVVIAIAQIQKIITDSCKNQAGYANAEALVKAVPAWAKKISTPQSPVFVADLWTNSDPKESADCVHPNEAGAERMGMNWYNALKGILK